MRRHLSAREMVLLILLLVLSLSSGYVLLFYTPVTEKIRQAQARLAQTEEQINQSMVNLERKKQMEASKREAPLKMRYPP